MYENCKKGIFFFIASVLVLLVSVIVGFTERDVAYAQEISDLRSEESQTISVRNTPSQSTVNIGAVGSSNFTDVVYIPNWKYFWANPKHADNNGQDNSKGTCTTIAMQLLMGYHNYYTDRRLIPQSGENGKIFLSATYNDFSDYPEKCTTPAVGLGNAIFGTEDGFYQEIFDLTPFASLPALGQAVGLVVTGAEKFVKKYALSIYENVNINSSLFSEETARKDIETGRPIILGMTPIGAGPKNFHVVPAYGYATYNGEFGFIVHCGWEDSDTQVWVPTSYFGYQIRLEINHVHNFIDSGNIVDDVYRQLDCISCGGKTLDRLYDVNQTGDSIVQVRYPLVGKVKIPEKIDGMTITSIGNNAFSGCTAEEITLSSNIILIGDSAFENCKQLLTISLPTSLYQIGNRAFRRCSALADIMIPWSVKSIGEEVFTECRNLQIAVAYNNANYSTQNNILYNKQKTELLHAGTSGEDIHIPVSVLKIASYAFAFNSNLVNIYIYGESEMGSFAFAHCKNLKVVRFLTCMTPVAGTGVFAGDDVTIFVPHDAQAAFKTAFITHADRIQSQEIPVTFIDSGETVADRIAYYGQTIADLPQREKSGYTFGGWYDNQNFTGKVYVEGDRWQSENALQLYAKWTARQFAVTLDAGSGAVVGENPIDVIYGEIPQTTTTATREGYKLDGWFDENGVEYIDKNGKGTRAWDKLSDTTLTAHWTCKSYRICVNSDGTIVWLGQDGIVDDPHDFQYGDVFDAINFIDDFKHSPYGFKTGKIFRRFTLEGNEVMWSRIPDLGEDGRIVTIYPQWELERHTIYFNSMCGIDVPELYADYGVSIALPRISRTGYTFLGWYDASSGGTQITWMTMPDLSEGEQSNGSDMLYAHWDANRYTVYYKSNDGADITYTSSHIYDVSKNLRVNTFTRYGYDFQGWATTSTGSALYADGQSVLNLTASGSQTLYAVWKAKSYSIVYKNLTKEMIVNPSTYTYGEGLAGMPKIFTVDPRGRLQEFENFYGWYDSTTWANRVYSISATRTGTVTVYAKYDYFISTTMKTSYTQTVTDGQLLSQPSYSVALLLDGLYYDHIKATTLSKIRITFSLELWEENDGYQDFYLQKEDGTTVWSTTIEHGAGKKNTTPAQYSFEIELRIADYYNVDYLDLRFGAHGIGADTWLFKNFTMSIFYVN